MQRVAVQRWGTNTGAVSRKDKRRHNIESKVAKISQNFVVDKDVHYRDRLTHLQTDLTSLHQGNNLQFMRMLRDLEEERDLELIRLRFYEEYRVQRSSIEFQEDIEKTKEEHEKMIKLCKEKLYESFEKKIIKLQEERLLTDVANAHSYSMDHPRTKQAKPTRSLQSAWDSSTSELGGGTGAGGASANESGTETGAERRSLRKRVTNNAAARIINEESEYVSNRDSSGPYGGSRTGTGSAANAAMAGGSQNNSDSEFLQYISDSNELYTLLFGSEERDTEKKKLRSTQRLSTKSAPPLQSLTPDEVTEDIALIRQLTGQPPAPFRI